MKWVERFIDRHFVAIWATCIPIIIACLVVLAVFE